MTDLAPIEPKPRWAQATGGAVALHVAVIALSVLTFRAATHVSLPAADTFRVTMAPAPPNDMTPGPVQDEAQPKPVEQPKVKLPFTPPPEVTAAPQPAIVLPKAADKPTPVVAKMAPAPAPVTTRPPAAPAAPTLAAPAPAVSEAASDAWLAKLLAQLEHNKRYPPKARYFHQQDTVLVHFTIDRQGKLLSEKIAKSQGFADIDAEVVALLKRSQPLIPPPVEVTGDTVTETVAIQFYLD